MTTTNRTFIRTSAVAGAALVAAALLLGTNMAQADEPTPVTTAKTDAATVKKDAKDAVHKTERVASDSWITTKVKSEILANSVSKGFKVSVKTMQGNVHLTGKLPTQDAVDVVKMTAEKVKGVKSVDTSGLEIGS